MFDTKYYIGVDGGGTKTHAVLTDQELKTLGETYAGPANINTDVEGAYISICTAITNLLARHGLSLNQVKIGVGVAGYSVIENRKLIINRLQDKYQGIVLNSDCHIACLAAHNNQDGAIVICGTGVVGYTIQNGRAQQLGGWGFPHGDLGGAAYLGLEVARLLCSAIDGVIPWNDTLNAVYHKFFLKDEQKCKTWLINAKPSDYAEITKFVFSGTTNNFTDLLLNQGANEIVQFIIALRKNKQNLPLKLVGGLAKLYIGKVKQACPEVEVSYTTPAIGAILSLRIHRQ